MERDWVTVSPRVATIDDLQALYDELNSRSNASMMYYAPSYRVKRLESDVMLLSISVILIGISLLAVIKRLEVLENVS